MNSYTLQSNESNYQNYASVQTVLSTKLTFDMYIVNPRSSYYINFGVSRRYCFLKDTKMSYITVYRLKIFLGRFNIVKLLESVQK